MRRNYLFFFLIWIAGVHGSLNRYAPIVREFMVCPYTTGVKLDCSQDGEIEVNYGFYGRDQETYACVLDIVPSIPPPPVCYVDGDEEMLVDKCDGKATCNILVEPKEGEPCSYDSPFVFIRHTCTGFVTPSIRTSSEASPASHIFDRSLLTHFESDVEEQPWIILSLNRSEIITYVNVHFHDDADKYISPHQVVVQVTSSNDLEPIFPLKEDRTCFRDHRLGVSFNCFNNEKKDSVAIWAKRPGRLGIKEVVISTIPEFVDSGYE